MAKSIFIENIYTNVDFQYKTDYNYGIMNIYDFSMNLVDSFECTQFNNYNNLNVLGMEETKIILKFLMEFIFVSSKLENKRFGKINGDKCSEGSLLR